MIKMVPYASIFFFLVGCLQNGEAFAYSGPVIRSNKQVRFPKPASVLAMSMNGEETYDTFDLMKEIDRIVGEDIATENTNTDLDDMCSLAKKGKVEEVRAMLEADTLCHLTRAHNLLLSAMAHQGLAVDAAEHLALMNMEGPEPNQASFALAIKACGPSHDWVRALQILSTLKSTGMKLTAETYQHAIGIVCSARQWQLALNLVDEMEARRLPPTERVLNQAICASDHAGDFESAKRYEAALRRQGITPNGVALGALVSASYKAKKPEETLQYFEERLASCSEIPSATLWTLAIRSHVQLKKPQEGLALFLDALRRGVSADQRMLTAAIGSCKDAGNWEAALGLLQRFEALGGVRPDQVAYSTALQALQKAGQADRAVALLVEMKQRGVEPSPFTYLTVMLALERAKDSKRLFSVVGLLFQDCREEIGEKDVLQVLRVCARVRSATAVLFVLQRAGERGGASAPTAAVYVEAMGALRKMEEWAKAFAVFRAARAAGAKLRPDAYGEAADACRRGNLGWRNALETFNDMARQGLEPNDPFIYNCVMSQCSQQGGVKVVLGLYQKMKESRTPPVKSTYHIVMTALMENRDWRRALKVYGEMEEAGVRPDAPLLAAALECAWRCRQHERVYALFQQALRQREPPRKVLYSYAVESLAAAGRAPEALLLLEEMRDTSIRPSFRCLNNLLKALGGEEGQRAAADQVEALMRAHNYELRPDDGEDDAEEAAAAASDSDLEGVDPGLAEAAAEAEAAPAAAAPLTPQEQNLAALHEELDALAAAGDLKAAVKALLGAVRDPSVLPTQATFRRVVALAEGQGDWAKALQVFGASVPFLPKPWIVERGAAAAAAGGEEGEGEGEGVAAAAEEGPLVEVDVGAVKEDGLVFAACMFALNKAQKALAARAQVGVVPRYGKGEVALRLRFADANQKRLWTLEGALQRLSPPLYVEEENADADALDVPSQVLFDWSNTKKARGSGNVATAKHVTGEIRRLIKKKEQP